MRAMYDSVGQVLVTGRAVKSSSNRHHPLQTLSRRTANDSQPWSLFLCLCILSTPKFQGFFILIFRTAHGIGAARCISFPGLMREDYITVTMPISSEADFWKLSC
jgi:hypothetical protein